MSTARIFGTVGCPFWYRILQMPEKRRALPAPNATKPERGKALLVPNATNARKEVPPLHRAQFRTPRRARKSQPKAPRCFTEASQPSPKHLNTSRKFFGTMRQHRYPAPASAPQPLPETLRQPQHPASISACASLDTLCVTKCHYLSFGKCFDVIRSVPSEMTDRMK